YCEGMDSSKYLPESWEALQAALADAYAVYETEGSEDSVYTEARARLEKVKCAMLFADTGTPEAPLPFREISGDALVRDMGAGINLRNTMDGHSNFAPNETSWQSVRTTKAYIKALHDAGFNTVRIPVTWGGTIDRDTYEISTKWLDRVEEIVDYCVSLGMYAIINIHHDGAEQTGWLRVASDDIDAVHEKFECVWRNIAERFKDYDEHLIFESMNEITCMREDKKNSQEAVDYDTPIIVDLNQIFVNIVRSTGSNNEKRWLAAVAHYANSGNHKDFVLPDDPAEVPHIMFAAHIYKSNTNTTWTYDEVYQVVNGLKMMADKFDVPMYLGEYGNRTKTQEGTATGYNDAARAYFSEIVHRACQTAGVVPVVWDQGYGEDKYETGLFTYWDREQCIPLFKSITDAMMRGTYLPNSELNDNWDYTDVTESPEVIPITKLDPDYKELEMVIGSTMYVSSKPEPIGNNDVVLWSSDDESVATVSHGSQGAVHAVGIGTTTIRLRTQNSDISSEIKLTVKAAEYENAPSEVLAPKDMIVEQGKSQLIGAALPEGTEGYLTYKSSDPDTVAVSPTGRVFAVGTGAAYVTITADSGASAVVRVYATEDADVAEQHAPTVMSDYSGGKADIDAVGGTAVLELTTEPFAPICFTSRNSAVVSVNSSTAITADENGKVRATVTAMSVGSTTVTARAINGAEISYEVNVLHETPSAPWLLIAGIAAAVIIAIVAVVILVRKKRNK
ncbi:MAG: cellulase family glycosylhydrolase, partial [Oscillospiraceae bacterium]|nr:cellulase family glycosylhydrolase [Oscillospiraceae bacterium]